MPLAAPDRSGDVEAPENSRQPRPIALTAWSLGYAMSIISGGMVSSALPVIARDTGVSPADSIWVLSASAIFSTATLLPAGALADSIGYKRVFQGGLLIFVCASVLAALSTSFSMLLVARAIQGLGSGAVLSCLGHFVRSNYPRDRMGRGLAFNSMLVSASTGGGPAMAAGILAVATWPWLFGGGVILGGAALLLSIRGLKDSEGVHHPIDVYSAILNALSLGLVIVSIQEVAHGGRPLLLAAEVTGMLVFGTLFVRRQLRMTKPILGLDLLKNPVISMALITMVVCYLAQGMAMASLPFFLYHEGDATGSRTALLLVCWPAAGMLTAPFAGRLADRFSMGVLGATGLAIFATGLMLVALSPAQASMLDMGWRIGLTGAGFALFGPPNTRGILEGAPPGRTGAATGLNGAFRGLSQSSGAAAVAVMFAYLANGEATDVSTRIVLYTAAGLAVAGVVLCLIRRRQAQPTA